MTDIGSMARLGLGGVAVAETAATWTRWEQRRRLFLAADARARQLGRPLLVVLPRKEGWFNRSMRLYEYGARYPDIFSRRNSPVIFADSLARGVAVQSDSAVVYVACVLEYVTDLRRSMDEICGSRASPRTSTSSPCSRGPSRRRCIRPRAGPASPTRTRSRWAR
jgi:hypothetical protein